MEHLDTLRQSLPEAAKDQKLNIQAILRGETIDAPASFAIAYTSALFIGADSRLVEALRQDGPAAGTSDAQFDDAHAAVALMRMNTVYYRFRHMVGKDSYQNMPPKLRMTRMAKPATNKATFELLSMACAALAGCELCITNHEQSLREEGVSEDRVHESVRIASVIAGFDASLRLPTQVGAGA